MGDIKAFWDMLKPLKEEVVCFDRRVRYLLNCRWAEDIRYISSNMSGWEDLLTERQRNGIEKLLLQGFCLAFANRWGGELVGISVRGLDKDFIAIRPDERKFNFGRFIGINNFDCDFKYGDPIILVEGIFDAVFLEPYFKNIWILQGSGIGKDLGILFRGVSEKWIVATDNDEAGENAFSNFKKYTGLRGVSRWRFVGQEKDVGKYLEFSDLGMQALILNKIKLPDCSLNG